LRELLLINDNEVRDLIGMKEAIVAVEDAFRAFAEGRATMPAKTYLDFSQYSGDLRVMPAAIGSTYAGVKIVNSHAHNPERGLPAVMGTYLLVAQETGVPLAIIDATYLTAVRTGAASAVATKFMARQDSKSVGLVGSGVQAHFQLEAMFAVLDIKRVVAWAPSNDSERRSRFVDEMAARFPDLEISGTDLIADAADSEVVCTTTPSHGPLVNDDMIKPGTHINAVGADGPGKQELEPALLKRSRIIVDEWEQASHGGEINVPFLGGELDKEDVTGSLPEVIAGRLKGRESDDQVTVFDSTGLAIEDIAVASLVYDRALDKNVGKRMEL
jgi:alanine dehydrogenase